ncbi:MAG: hypothetical protein ACE5IK_09280 [Acidobacteriota bacterium]
MTRSVRFILATACLLLVGPAAGPAHADGAVALDDLIRLVEGGVGPSVILYEVERSGLAFELDVDAILALSEAGADESLIRSLLRIEPPESSPAPSETHHGVRLIRDHAADGSVTVTLTNLSTSGQRLDSRDSAPVRGIISSATRDSVGPAEPASRTTRTTGPPREPVGLLPSSIEVTVKHADTEGGDDARLAAVEDRLAGLEERPRRPPVGANFPQHPINDHRDYPIVSYPGGYPLLIPFAFEPVEFRVFSTGPFPSFTSAFHGGFNPFTAPAPCRAGVACSVAQRLATR